MERKTDFFPGERKKAFTLSYDDGIQQDRRLVSIFNKYNLKATFNLNSGIQSEESNWIGKNNIKISRINIDEIKELYNGYEVAVHSLTHPRLQNLPESEIYKELYEDKRNLENIFGYTVEGMAYPYGTYDDKVKAVMRKVGIKYSRTVNQHCSFVLPEDYLEWHPTCHHSYSGLMELAKDFVNSQSDELQLFYVWGHSYEFDEQNNWELIEEFCSYIANRENVWYATNLEIMKHLNK